MGRYHCDRCGREVDDGEFAGCGESGCPSGSEPYCSKCADTSSPACGYCDRGCSACVMVTMATLDDFDLERCEHPGDEEGGGCPLRVMSMAEDGEMCVDCFTRETEKLGCDAYGGHEHWTFAECGHNVCQAEQNWNECDDDVCYIYASTRKM